MLDAEEVLELVQEEWNVDPQVPFEISNGTFESGTLDSWELIAVPAITNLESHSGTYSVNLMDSGPSGILQMFGKSIAKSAITTFGFWYMGTGGVDVTLYFSDLTDKTMNVITSPYDEWHYADILTLVYNLCTGELLFPIDKEVIGVEFNGVGGTGYVDDIVLSVDGELALRLDEFEPNCPKYQIVFINRPERTMFVAPNVIKHEQDIHVEARVKLIRYDKDEVLSKRDTFKVIKGELSRIFNEFRYDNVGSTINVSAWMDNKLPHGFGDEDEPLEFITRLTLQIFYYESLDDSRVGVRVSRVEIIGDDLLGLIDTDWLDTNPWVKLQVPKGPLIHQHLLGPEINGTITTHDYESLYERLYETPIVESGVQYPILVDGTKIKFSTDIPNDPQFIIEMIDDEGGVHTYDFYNVRIRQVELLRSNTSGQTESVWKIHWTADYVYYTPP